MLTADALSILRRYRIAAPDLVDLSPSRIFADVKRPLGSDALKILLIPIAIVAFIVFLIVLGAIGLGVAFLILTRWGIWRVLPR